MTLEVQRKCRVHRNIEECVSSEMVKFKVAVALVLIRAKPPGQSIRDFIENLQLNHKDKEERWKSEYCRLKKEVLQLRQQQVLHRLYDTSCPATYDRMYAFERNRNNQQTALMVLTPPTTQPPTSVISSIGLNEDHVSFLRAYFYVDHQLRSQPTDISENDVVHQSVLSILRHVDRSVQMNRTDFSKSADSLRMCLQLMDANSKWTPSVLEQFLSSGCRWLQSINTSDSNSMKYLSLLQALADSSLAPLMANFIVKQIENSQKILAAWSFNGAPLPPDIFSSFVQSANLFLLLEATIPRLPPADRQNYASFLSKIDPNVHLNFPLFAAAMMRSASMLATEPV